MKISNTITIEQNRHYKITRPLKAVEITYSTVPEQRKYGITYVTTTTATSTIGPSDIPLLAISKYTDDRPEVFVGSIIDADSSDNWVDYFTKHKPKCDVCGKYHTRMYHLQTGDYEITTICSGCAPHYGINDTAGDMVTDLAERITTRTRVRAAPDLWDLRYAIPLILAGKSSGDTNHLDQCSLDRFVAAALRKVTEQQTDAVIKSCGIAETHIDIDGAYSRQVYRAFDSLTSADLVNHSSPYGDVWK